MLATQDKVADDEILVSPGKVTLPELRHLLYSTSALQVGVQARNAVHFCHTQLGELIGMGGPIYGVNTGFGKLANIRIGNEDLNALQRNLILSHCTGFGADLGDDVVRLVMILKVIGLARGHSGVQWHIIQMIMDLIRHQIYPCIPSKGSVGASGDLAPLAHLAAVLIGIGEARQFGKIVPAVEALSIAGHTPAILGPKEGLALINGTQVCTALALTSLFATENLFSAALIAGALSVEASLGGYAPFDDRIHTVRGHAGQVEVGAAFRKLFFGSSIRSASSNLQRVQDPYSLRCQPQVMGAVLESIRHCAAIFEVEANAVSDNPIIFPDTLEVLSGGNFHAEPVAIAADLLAIAIAEIGSISERRVAFLVDSNMSGLPPFLVENSGLKSGFMVAQITAAALASENKALAHPSSVDSIPTAANQEDHVSMATYAARRLGEMINNTSGIVSIELLAAAQGLDFRRPLKSSELLEAVHIKVRETATHYNDDMQMSETIETIGSLVRGGTFNSSLPLRLPSLG